MAQLELEGRRWCATALRAGGNGEVRSNTRRQLCKLDRWTCLGRNRFLKSAAKKLLLKHTDQARLIVSLAMKLSIV